MESFTLAYFNEQCVEMRRIWGDKKYSVEQVSRAMTALLYVYCNVVSLTEEEDNRMIRTMQAMTAEYDRRLMYRVVGV